MQTPIATRRPDALPSAASEYALPLTSALNSYLEHDVLSAARHLPKQKKFERAKMGRATLCGEGLTHLYQERARKFLP